MHVKIRKSYVVGFYAIMCFTVSLSLSHEVLNFKTSVSSSDSKETGQDISVQNIHEHLQDSAVGKITNDVTNSVQYLEVPLKSAVVNLDLILTKEVDVVFTTNDESRTLAFELHSPDPYNTGTSGTTLHHSAMLSAGQLYVQLHVSRDPPPWHHTQHYLVASMVTIIVAITTVCVSRVGRHRKRDRRKASVESDTGTTRKLCDDQGYMRAGNDRTAYTMTEDNDIIENLSDSTALTQEVTNEVDQIQRCKKSEVHNLMSELLKFSRLSHLRVLKSKSLPVSMVIGFSLILMIVIVYAGKGIGSKQTLKIGVPEDALIRKVRSYSEKPSLRAISLDGNSMSLVQQLQLLDVTDECKTDLSACKRYAVCDTLQGTLNCRCKRGYYIHDKQCRRCSTSCRDGFFMLHQCSAERDVTCQACTTCSGSQYTAAPCTSTQDAICLDVTFPMNHVNWNATIPDSNDATLDVTSSKNVFVEKLKKVKNLETTLFITNNQQLLEFPFFRESGLEIRIKFSQTFLVPEYVDLDHLDDTEYFKRFRGQTAEALKRMQYLQDNYCRSVLPEHYKIILEIMKDQYTQAKMDTCDPDSAMCPQGYSKGDKYLNRDMFKKCPLNDGKSDNFSNLILRHNAIFCPLPNTLLTETFGLKPSEIEKLKFPTAECKQNSNYCRSCIDNCKGQPEGDSGACCKVKCYSQDFCQKMYSDDCPVKPVQCSRGDVNAFYVEPVFDNILRKFMCHLQYREPAKLYQIEYEVRMPSIQYTLNKQVHVIKPGNKTFHKHGTARSGFIVTTHDTFPYIHDEVILVGNRFRGNVPTKFVLHKMKDPEEFNKRKNFRVRPNRSDLKPSTTYSTHAQFERPFLYSTITWNRGGCFSKNFSQIYPPQHLYVSKPMEIDPYITRSGGQFVYQAAGKSVTMKVFISGNESILSYYQDEFKDARIVSSSLRGDLVWIEYLQLWNFSVSGTLSKCPGYITMEVYDQSMEARLDHYDIFVKCPVNFTITNSIKKREARAPQIFVVFIKDSTTTHKVFLTQMLGPTQLPIETSAVLTSKTLNGFPWIPIIISLIFSAIVLAVFLVVAIYISKIKIVTTDEIFNYPGVTFINKEEGRERLKSDSSTATRRKPISRRIQCVLLTLYVAYALTFTFSMLLGVFYIVQGPLINNLTIVSNTSAKIQKAFDTHLQNMEQFQNEEITRLFNETYDRLRACSYHTSQDMEKMTIDIQRGIDSQVKYLYHHNQTLYGIVKSTLEEKANILSNELNTFLTEYNKTIQNHFHSVLTNYTEFLKSLMRNEWLKFPQEIFINQKEVLGDNSGMEHLLWLMSWLEVEKVEETLGVADRVIDRLSKSLPHLEKTPAFKELPTPLKQSDLEDSFNQDTIFSFQVLDQETASFLDPSIKNVSKHKNSSQISTHDIIQTKASLINRMKEILFPVFICVFLLMDALMLAYRFTWLREMFVKAKHGVEEKIATDPVAGKILFTLSGNDAEKVNKPIDKPYNYMMDNKSEVFAGKNELYLLYCATSQKSKEDVLRDIWTHKQRQKSKMVPTSKEDTSVTSKVTLCVKFMYKHLISPIFWRFVLVGAFVLVICVVIKATNDLVSIETATFLMDTKSIFPQLHRQTSITNTLLSDFLVYSNNILRDFKHSVDVDLDHVSTVLMSSLQKQNQALQSQLSEICTMSSIPLCNINLQMESFQSSLLPCNFLPLHVSYLKEFQEENFLYYLHTELYPLVKTLRLILFNMCYILFVFACLMLICHIFIRVIIFYLIKTNRLPKVMMYLLSNANECWKQTNCQPPDSVYRSNSLIESCESGVVGDIDDTYRDPALLLSTERRIMG